MNDDYDYKENHDHHSSPDTWETLSESTAGYTHTDGVNIHADFTQETPPAQPPQESASAPAALVPPPKKPHTALKVVLILAGILLIFLALVLSAYAINRAASENADGSASALSSSSGADTSHPTFSINDVPKDTAAPQDSTGEMATEAIYEKISPSIVGIEAYITDTSAQTYASASTASGIVMNADGYIITNAHVVVDTDTMTAYDQIDVHLSDDTVYPAQLVGADVKTDLAVIKIAVEGLTPAEFGDSSALKVGEKAVAIGNPTGLTLSSSLTQGVISGINRDIPIGTTGSTMSCIQIDAAINPGNSGGALINKYGQVVGITSNKIVETSYEGIGFAIPINEAKPILDDLIANGYVTTRVRIGITFRTVPESISEKLGVPAGLRVVTVDETTDAYAKGVTSGDIITHIEGEPVLDLDDVSAILNQKKAGDTVTLTIYRVVKNKAQTVDIEVELQQDTTAALR